MEQKSPLLPPILSVHNLKLLNCEKKDFSSFYVASRFAKVNDTIYEANVTNGEIWLVAYTSSAISIIYKVRICQMQLSWVKGLKCK